MELLRSTWRSLRAHAMRFTLTSLGIVWGAFMLTYLSAASEGIDRHFTRVMQKAGPKIVYMGGGAILKQRVGERGARLVKLEEDDVARVEAIALIEDASPMISIWNELVRNGRVTKLLQVQGVTARADVMRNYQAADGRFFSPIEVERGARVAFLGSDAAERLFGGRAAVGHRLQIGGTTFRVVGVAVAKGAEIINSMNPDDLKILVPYTTAQRWLTRSDDLGEIAFTPLTRETSFEAIRRVRETLSRHHDFHPELDTALWFFNIQEPLQMVRGMQVALRLFLLVAGITTLLVGAVGVMNIMLVVVGERTNEIGLRKAVGATRRAIFVQFFAEAATVCLLSGVLGASLGVAMAQLTARTVPPDSAFSSIPVVDPVTVVAVTVGLVLVGMLAGVAPALRASQVPPADALRAV
jgi:putative ABC transport system permease protein